MIIGDPKIVYVFINAPILGIAGGSLGDSAFDCSLPRLGVEKAWKPLVLRKEG